MMRTDLSEFLRKHRRQSWAGITYVRVRPQWARYSDFNPGGKIIEFTEAQLTG